jgi:hypothetical protein
MTTAVVAQIAKTGRVQKHRHQEWSLDTTSQGFWLPVHSLWVALEGGGGRRRREEGREGEGGIEFLLKLFIHHQALSVPPVLNWNGGIERKSSRPGLLQAYRLTDLQLLSIF